MPTWSRVMVPAVVLVLLSFLSCAGTEQPSASGFAVSLAESGDLILGDEHIAAYVWDEHRIRLTPAGARRWASFVELDTSQDPPIPKLGRLTAKQFVVTLNGAEMYRGHFSSRVSSLLGTGVLLYDTLGVPEGEVWMTFIPSDGEPLEDPRDRPEIKAYFRAQGRIVVGD